MSALTAPEIILRPVVSEKSIDQSTRGRYTFRVHPKANKIQIKAAVEALFDRKVKSVNTLTQKGKTKRWKGRPYSRSDMKKAVVTLAEGQSIDVMTAKVGGVRDAFDEVQANVRRPP